MAESKTHPRENLPVVRPAGEFSLSFSNIGPGLEGDFGAEASRLPFLSVGQRTSDITEAHPEALGAIVYAGRHIVGKTATITIYGARQYYRQNLAFERNPSVRPLTFPTKEGVLAAGGNLEKFIKAGVDDNNYVTEMVAKTVIFSPAKGWAKGDDVLSHPAGRNGTLVVPALWTLRGVAYGENTPNLRMIDRALREDQKELAYAKFTMSVVKRIFSGGNSTFVPVLERLPEDNSGEIVEVLRKIFAL